MNSNHTGLLKVPLVSGTAGDNPSLTQGAETTFGLANLPAERDGLASYLLGIVVYISGNFVQAGGAGTAVPFEDLIRALIASVSVRNAWHGTPLNPSWCTGADFALWGYVLNGYRFVQRVLRQVPAANGTYPFNLRLFIPLMLGTGKKPHHTAQLALLYRDATFGINVAAASVGTGLSTGSSITGLNVRATGMCLLEPELRIGPALELVDYTSPTPAAASFESRFQDFANNTGISGTERGAGIAWAALRSSLRGGGGPVDFSTLTRIGVPFRGQPDMSDPASFLDEAIDAMGGSRVVGSIQDSATAGLTDTSGYPNIVGALDPLVLNTPIRASTLLGYPIVNPTADLELSKIQRVDETIVISQTYSAAPSAGTHHLLTAQLREWTPEKREQWRELVIQTNLARKVLGDVSDFSHYAWQTKLMNKQDAGIVDPKKMRYLPLRLANTEGRRPGAAG